MVQCKYLTTDDIINMDINQLIEAYRQGYKLKDFQDFQSLAPNCPTSSIAVGQTININSAPLKGTPPYTVTFYKKLNVSAPVQIGTTQTGVPEAIDSVHPSTTTQPYTVTDADVIAATGDLSAIPPLAIGKIRIIADITDSCPIISGGSKTCSESCDISLICVAPECNIIVEIAP